MLESTAIALNTAARGSLYAMPAAALAGAISSAGPCIVPRCIVLGAISSKYSRGTAIANGASFFGGTVLAHGSFAIFATMVAKLLSGSRWSYGALAAGLAAAGLRVLWDTGSSFTRTGKPPTCGTSALLGMALSLVPSACCAPVILCLLSLTSAGGNMLFSFAVLACFAIGHCVALSVVTLSGRRLETTLQRLGGGRTAAVIAGSIMLGMSGYYAILV